MSLRVTQSGRAVARSGLLPTSADELLGFLSNKGESLQGLMKACAESELDDCDDFAFVLMHAAFSSSEYSNSPVQRRFLPYQLLTAPLTGPQQRLREYLFQPHQADSINAAVLASRWIAGTQMRLLESALDIRSGVLNSMFADGANILRGLADVLYATTSPQAANELPTSVPAASTPVLITLVAAIRRIATRLDFGLPDDVVWMRTLTDGGVPAVSRNEIMLLREANFLSPEHILDPGRFPQLLDVFGARSNTARTNAQTLQQSVRTWRLEERARLIESQRKRLPPECRDLLLRFHRAREIEFEDVLAEAFQCFAMNIEARDDRTTTSFPDFILRTAAGDLTALECKSKTVGDSVTFNDATEVIRKASVNGFSGAFKVTVCQPYISPDVPRKLSNCDELCVVNAEDLAEAFVRLRNGKITQASFDDWLRRPGQALKEHLVSATPQLVAPAPEPSQ